jgi:ribulose-bisphosphate carboxylase large chain
VRFSVAAGNRAAEFKSLSALFSKASRLDLRRKNVTLPARRMERIVAKYFIETPLAVERAAATLAGEQSSGTFVAVPGETEELKQRFAARVEKITPMETVSAPSLPGAKSAAGKFQRAEVVVSWSLENMGYNLPTLVSTIQGNLYEITAFTGLKLIDVELPPSFAQHFCGPKFGVAGTRRLTGVGAPASSTARTATTSQRAGPEAGAPRPLIGTIIKPSIGMSPQQTADLVKVLCEAGIDFIKDDELMANPLHSPFDERVDAIMRVINAHADRTGKKVMYAFNVSDEMDAMQRHYEKIVKSAGTCAMISLNSVGLSGAKKICDLGALAIHGHRNGWGMLNRHPLLGIEFPAYQKIWRLAGVDQLHVNGIANKFWESDDSVVRSIEACAKPLWSGAPASSTARSGPIPQRAVLEAGAPILPVVSSGQWGGQACETFRRTKTVDLLYMAGGGIMAHPDGPAAGVRSLQKWWEAAVEGLTKEQAAAKYPELKKSVEKFGKK